MKTKNLVLTALFASLTCIFTMIIKIPSPFKGYINLGDGIVLFSGWLLPPFYGFLASGVGSALADVFLGYAIYSPVTFLIKGIMALVFGLFSKKANAFMLAIGGIFSELVMIIGYYAFEGFLYGFSSSAVNILPNSVQAVVGIVVSMLLIKVFKESKL